MCGSGRSLERYLLPPFRSRAPKSNGCPTANSISARGQPPPPQTRRVSFQVKPDDSPVNEHRDLATDPRERLKDMDRDGIERGMLFPSAGLYLTSVEEEAYAAARTALTIVGCTIIAARIENGSWAWV